MLVQIDPHVRPHQPRGAQDKVFIPHGHPRRQRAGHVEPGPIGQRDRQAIARIGGHLHVSFDLDFVDPGVAPGVGTPVPGGPTYREAQLCMEMIHDSGLLGSLDVVEVNPALDARNRTAELAVELIESLFGERILARVV